MWSYDDSSRSLATCHFATFYRRLFCRDIGLVGSKRISCWILYNLDLCWTHWNDACIGVFAAELSIEGSQYLNQWLGCYPDLRWQDCFFWVAEYRWKLFKVPEFVAGLQRVFYNLFHSRISHGNFEPRFNSKVSSTTYRASFHCIDRYGGQNTVICASWFRINTLVVRDVVLCTGQYPKLPR